MNILITGGDGFIARELTYYFNRDDEHKIFIRSKYELPLLDSKKVDLWFDWNAKEIDAIIHTAAIGGSRLKEDGVNVFYDNVEIWRNISRNAKKHNLLLFNFTSGAEGDGNIQLGLHNPYGTAKALISSFIKEIPENVVNLKVWNCFGKYGKDTRFIEGNINNYIAHKPFEIHEDKLFDFFYSEDIYKIIQYFLIEKEDKGMVKSKKISCVYPEVLSLTNVAKIINNLADYRVEIPKTLEWKACYCETNLSNRYRFLDFVGLEKGIEAVYDYRRNNE